MVELENLRHHSSGRGGRLRGLCRWATMLVSDVVSFLETAALTWFMAMLPFFMIGVCLVLRFYIWLVFVPLLVFGSAAEYVREKPH